MDTIEKYRNDPLLEVEHPPKSKARETHIVHGGPQPPVDGWVHILYRDPDDPQGGRDEDGRWYAGSFPFRDHRDDEHPWFGLPDADKWNQHPIWKWQNPDKDPHENLTLKPSIETRTDGEITFHCYVTDGEIDWL